MNVTRKLFLNIFSSKSITPQRLRTFGKAVLSNLSKQNKDGQYTALITLLSA